jgi:hypothetical protein
MAGTIVPGAALPIVKRLRSTGTALFQPDHPVALLTWEAADTIERMQALIEKQLRQKASAAWDSEARVLLAKLDGSTDVR